MFPNSRFPYIVAINDETRARAAVKIIDKTKLDDKLNRKIRQEIQSLKTLERHPNVVQLMDVIESESRICLIMEYCEGGELFDHINHNERVRAFPNDKPIAL